MNDEEYYNFVRPYADAMQMLLTRLDVLNQKEPGRKVDPARKRTDRRQR